MNQMNYQYNMVQNQKQPYYVLRTNEDCLMPVKQSAGLTFVKVGVWVVVGFMVLGSLIFQENLFFELEWSTRILFILLAIGVTFYGGKKDFFPSPMELSFFDDHFELYLPKKYLGTFTTRREIYTMNYADVTDCVYTNRGQRIHFYGNGTSVWWNYRRDGTLPQNPSANRTWTSGMIYFGTRCAPEVDFIREIESHSPIRVRIEP